MGEKFDGDVQRFRKRSAERLARILGGKIPPTDSLSRTSFENFGLVLSLIPKLRYWSSAEKQGVLEILRARSGREEMPYLHLLQHHSKLRESLIRVGSKG